VRAPAPRPRGPRLGFAPATATPCDGSSREGGVDDHVLPDPDGIVRNQEQDRGASALYSPLRDVGRRSGSGGDL
jgi:hypothetical protein